VTDPVDIATGEMVFRHVDLELPEPLGLALERTHVSSYRAGGWFGPTWASTLDERLEFDSAGVCWFSPDGMILVYPPAEPGVAVLPEEGPRLPLTVHADRSAELTDPRTGRTSTFRAAGNVSWLRAIEDGSGNRVEIDRDENGAPTALRHPGGRRVTITADGDRISALHASSGAGSALVARFGYDERRHLSEITNAAGQTSRLSYDDEGRIVAWRDRAGATYRYTYDADGRCVATAGDGGFLDSALAYDLPSSSTSYTDSLGHTTRYQLDAAHQIVAETDPLGNTTRNEWDRYHRLLSRTDPLGRTTAFEYDETGALAVVVRPDGSRVSLHRSAPGAEPRLEIAVADGERTWRRTYAGPALPDPLEVPIGVASDPDAATEDAPVVRAATGTGAGEVWTPDGTARRKLHPGGGIEQWRYDGEGNEVEHVGAAGAVTRAEFGMFGLRTADIDAEGRRTTYAYDTELRLTTVTTPAGLSWHYRYDAAGRVVEETDFDGRTTRYAYDAAGQLVRTTTATGEHIDYTYDLLGSRIRRETPTGVTHYRYDPVGRLVVAAGSDALLRLDRDGEGRVIAQTVNGRTLAFDYDDEDGTTLRRTPGGTASVWRHDEDGRPELLATAGHVLGFGHDGSGRETVRQVDGVRILEQTYDPDGALTVQRLAEGHERRYHRRLDGVPVGVEDSAAGRTDIEVDVSGRAVAVQAGGHREHYGYDDLGNVVRAALDGRDVPEAGERHYSGTSLLEAGVVSYTYDAAGRRTARTVRVDDGTERTWRYEWDTLDRLLGVETPEGTYWRYRYDPLGRRIAKQRLADRNPEDVQEEVRYTWDGTVLVEQEHATPDGVRRVTSWNHHPGDGRPLVQSERVLVADAPVPGSDVFTTIVADTVGAPAVLADAAGRVVGQARCTLWGQGDDAGTALRFPGQVHDSESGLHYNVYRYYDPAVARYVSPDPLGLAPAPNPVSYVDNPMVGTDPLGLTSPCKAGSSSLKRKRDDVRVDVDIAADTASGTAKNPRTDPVLNTGKYTAGQHGNKSNEQVFLREKFGQPVHGASGSNRKGNRIEATHESEHPVGYEVLAAQADVKRGTPISKGGEDVQRVENTAPAYQEAAEAHRDHIGTGTTKNIGTETYTDVDGDGNPVTFEAPSGYGYNSIEYRAHQTAALDSNDIASAIQLNQLGYAHTPAFGASKNTVDAAIADDSFVRMVDNVGEVERFTGATTTASVEAPTANGRAEMFLAREAANTGNWPTAERRIEIMNYFLDRENGVGGQAPPVLEGGPLQ
jgi:RHS repeat-associated protein